jgi:hypothetical protein
METLQGKRQSLKSALLLNKECISLLRQRVEDLVLGVSDEAIGSVAFLTIVEVSDPPMFRPFGTSLKLF